MTLRHCERSEAISSVRFLRRLRLLGMTEWIPAGAGMTTEEIPVEIPTRFALGMTYVTFAGMTITSLRAKKAFSPQAKPSGGSNLTQDHSVAFESSARLRPATLSVRERIR